LISIVIHPYLDPIPCRVSRLVQQVQLSAALRLPEAKEEFVAIWNRRANVFDVMIVVDDVAGTPDRGGIVSPDWASVRLYDALPVPEIVQEDGVILL
jgi:hypothetical protein